MTISIERTIPFILLLAWGGAQGTEPESASAADHRSAADAEECPLEGAEIHADDGLRLTTGIGDDAVVALQARANAHVTTDHDAHH